MKALCVGKNWYLLQDQKNFFVAWQAEWGFTSHTGFRKIDASMPTKALSERTKIYISKQELPAEVTAELLGAAEFFSDSATEPEFTIGLNPEIQYLEQSVRDAIKEIPKPWQT